MFKFARIKLTAWYILLTLLISSMFSLVIYRVLSSEVDRFSRIQRFRFELSALDPDLISDAKHRILVFLILVNGGVLVISGGLSYWLAGETLKPIKNMVDDQNRFISDASHELKTPLTSLKIAFEVFLLNHKATLAASKTLVKESIGEVDKLQNLSESLLKLAQYQTPNGHSSVGRVTVKEITTEAVKRISPQAKIKHITISENVGSTTLVSDKFSLTDLVVLLLDNAIKYSPEGSKVHLSAKSTGGRIEIAVADAGVGIKPADLPHIFDRFYRTDMARSKTGSGGFGLGLAIAKKIAQSLHANISVASQVGRGSTFSVRFQ